MIEGEASSRCCRHKWIIGTERGQIESMIAQAISSVANHLGIEIRPSGFSSDFDDDSAEIIRRVSKYTMTTPERTYSMIQAVKYVIDAGVQGDIVECGVWRGGSMMAAALTLSQMGRADVALHLFDTYEGMSTPTGNDVDFRGRPAQTRLSAEKRTKESHLWAYASLEDVRHNMETTGYPQNLVHYVRGPVESTLPENAPETISLLRLDTDWYESTWHELKHLYPRLVSGGVLILDDYGHWQGSRQAYDEYAKENGLNLLLNRIDYTCRVAIKP